MVSFLPWAGPRPTSRPRGPRPASELGGVDDARQLDEGHDGEHDQDQGGGDRPADLQARVAVDLGRHGALLGPELDHRVQQRALDDDEHDGRDVQDDPVQRGDLVGVRRSPGLRGDEVGQRRRSEHQRADNGERHGQAESGKRPAAALGVVACGLKAADSIHGRGQFVAARSRPGHAGRPGRDLGRDRQRIAPVETPILPALACIEGHHESPHGPSSRPAWRPPSCVAVCGWRPAPVLAAAGLAPLAASRRPCPPAGAARRPCAC